jgi:hypothetical protein
MATKHAPAGLCIPLGPGLSAFVALIHGEGIRRGWLPDGLTIEEFAESAVYQIAKALMDYRLIGMDPKDLRLLDEPKMVQDYTGDRPVGWVAVIE